MSLEASGLALLGTVADRLQLEAMGIEPVGRKTVRPVLEELLGFVEDDGVASAGPLMCFPDNCPARDQECEVMKAWLQT
jgi:hypothetical protein